VHLDKGEGFTGCCRNDLVVGKCGVFWCVLGKMVGGEMWGKVGSGGSENGGKRR